MPTPALPYDVLRYVFDKIPDEKTCLKQCSLVCRSWAFPAAHHLFRELTVLTWLPTGPLTHSDLALLVQPDKSMQICSNFLDVVRSSERIQSYLRTLVFRGNWSACDAFEDTWPDSDAPPQRSRCPLGIFQDIISVLPHLQDLSFDNIEFYPSPTLTTPESSSISQARRGIEILDITALQGQVGGILRCFTNIGKLYVGYYPGSALDKIPSGLATVKLFVLHFYLRRVVFGATAYPEPKMMIDTLCDVIDFNKLDHIELEQDRFTQYPEDIIRLLTKCHALTGFSVKCPDYSEAVLVPESVVARCKLPPCVAAVQLFRLWSIELFFGHEIPDQVSDLGYQDAAKVEWACMCAMLATIPTNNSIGQVKLGIDVSVRRYLVRAVDRSGIQELLEELDWARFDHELCRLENIPQLTFKVTETTRFGEEFIFVMRTKLSEKSRNRITIKRHIAYTEKRSYYGNTDPERDAKLSMDAVDKYRGITVLRTDASNRYQEIRLS